MQRPDFAMQRVCCFSWALLIERLGQCKSSTARISEDAGKMLARFFPPTNPVCSRWLEIDSVTVKQKKHWPLGNLEITSECTSCQFNLHAGLGEFFLPPFTPNSPEAPYLTPHWPRVMRSHFLQGEPSKEFVSGFNSRGF